MNNNPHEDDAVRKRSYCCCGIFKLRDGCKFIAIFCFIYGFYEIGIGIFKFVIFSQKLNVHHYEFFLIFKYKQYNSMDMVLEMKEYHPVIRLMLSLSITCACINIILSGLLFYGACIKDKSLVTPWLHYNFIICLLYIGLNLYLAICILMYLPRIILTFLGNLVIPIAIQIYILRIVHGYVVELRTEAVVKESRERDAQIMKYKNGETSYFDNIV